jgi:hypothetical protein
MTLTGITHTILDGALGAVPETIENKLLVMGVSSTGTANTVQSFSDVRAAQTALGYGPLVEAIAHHLNVLGEGPVYAVKVAPTGTTGSVGAWTKSNGSAPTVSSSGTPSDNYELKVLITKSGTLTAAEFKYSLDNGDTYSAVIVTATTYVLANTGITIAFAAGSYVAGDTYTAASVPTAMASADIGSAFDGLLASTYEPSLIHIVGVPVDMSAMVALATAIESELESANTAYRYMRCFIEAANENDATLQGATAVALETEHVVICAGFVELYSHISGRWYKRPAAWPIVARAASNKVHRHIGAVADGSLPNIKTSAGTTSSGLYRDERVTPGLSEYRYCVLRSRIGIPGYYVEDDNTFAASGSDYSSLTNCRVMDKAVRTANVAMQPYINIDLELTSAGKIKESQAKAIEEDVNAILRNAMLPDSNCSDVQFIVSRTDDILSTKTFKVKTRVLPKGYAKYLEHEIGFTKNIPTS